MKICLTIGCLACVAASAIPLRAEDWPRFRGPNGGGVSQSGGLPEEVGLEQNLLWRVDSGQGISSPVLAADRLYFTSMEGDTRTVHCLNAGTGETLWTRSAEKVREENASRPNGPAACTPATDGTSVVAFFPDSGLFCYSADGCERWRIDPGPFHSMHGIAGSPILVDDLAVLSIDQLRGSRLSAYRIESGQAVWTVPRIDGVTGGYSTPSLYETLTGESQIIASGPQELCGYRATTGEKLWSVLGVTNAPISVPVISADMLFVCEPVGTAQPISMLAPLDANHDGKLALDEVKENVPISRLLERIDREFGNGDGVVEPSEWDEAFGQFVGKGGLSAIDLADSGEPQVCWSYRKSVPYVASPLIFEDVVYLVQDGGIVTTLDWRSGEVHRRGRLAQGGQKFYASPVVADGKVFLVDTAGQLTILRAGAQWQEMATAALGEPCFATPAICEGRIYVRTARSLFCFGKGDAQAANAIGEPTSGEAD